MTKKNIERKLNKVGYKVTHCMSGNVLITGKGVQYVATTLHELHRKIFG